MILYTRDFPSKGYGCLIQDIELRPLNYKELTDYVNNDEFTKVREFMKDINLAIRMDPKVEDVLIIDIDYVLYIMKALTISDTITFNYQYRCSCCGKMKSGSISSQNLVFRSIDERYMNLDSITLGDKELKFRLITVKEFKQFITKLPRNFEDTDLKILKLCSMFWDGVMNPGQLIDMFLNTVGDEIKIIAYLKAAYFDCIKPITLRCERGGETVVTLSDVTTNLFQLLLQNRRIDQDKIHFKQLRED